MLKMLSQNSKWRLFFWLVPNIGPLLFLLLALLGTPPTIHALNVGPTAYHGVNIEIDENAIPLANTQNCQHILTSLESTLSAASAALYAALDGRYYFGDFNIFLPQTWEEVCIPPSPSDQESARPNAQFSPSQGRQSTVSTGGVADITITNTHKFFGDVIWTKQYGGCGVPGDRIYASYKSLGLTHSGKEFVKEWAKYRYGVFDEIGFYDDPIYVPCYTATADEGLRVTGCTDHENPENVDIQNHCSATSSSSYQDFMRLFVSELRTARTSLMFAPHGVNVAMFCDAGNHDRYAPTKQNYMCDRQSTLDVILQHPDFINKTNAGADSSGAQIINTKPSFNYRRRTRTRYIVVIDDSLDISQRESWGFLRSAFRKWVVYDLMPNSEVGVVLANGRIVEKALDLTPLTNATNRDLVASFLPYTPSDSRQLTCISCALDKALNILEQRSQSHGNASNVILIIAPGMDQSTNVNDIQQKLHSRKTAARIATINYPDVIAPRQPLDTLALATDGGIGFSVHEQKFNSEKSYLTSYVQLTNVLADIGEHFHEASSRTPQLPVEIHRNEIYDSSNEAVNTTTSTLQRNTRQVRGEFHLEENFGLPAGFYIYTHSAETPLIQAMRLISPSGRTYMSRSDQRMPVKQLTLMTALNETGRWRYEIERYPGNPQPHVVQVMATPIANSVRSRAHVSIRAWVVRTGSGRESLFTLYCDVKHGEYPVREAEVRASLRYHDKFNNTEMQQIVELWDTGAGEPDIMLGDGIYSRQLSVLGPGTYTFDFYVKGRNHITYTISQHLGESDLGTSACCGSEYAPSVVNIEGEERRSIRAGESSTYSADYWKYTIATGPFERYGPMLTFYVQAQEFAKEQNTIFVENTHVEDVTLPHENDTNKNRSNKWYGGRILNLMGAYNNEILNLSWTALEKLGNDIAKYEIRYGTNIVDMVDRFEQMPLLDIYDKEPLLDVVKIGSLKQSYSYDLTEPHTPDMYGKDIFFAIRPRYKWQHFNNMAPVSNVVQIKIPPKVVPTASPPLYHLTPDFTNSQFPTTMNGNDTSNGGPNTVTSVDLISQRDIIRYAVPLCILLLLLLAALCFICFVTRCRYCRRGSAQHNNNKITTPPTASTQDFTTPSPTHMETDDGGIGSGGGSFMHNSYSALSPDHHIVGIPIYDDDISKKRLSMSGGSQGYTIEELKLSHCPLHAVSSEQYVRLTGNNNISGSNGNFYNGNGSIHIISSNDAHMPHQPQKTLGACESWSATQLLREHQARRTSPSLAFDQQSLEEVGGVPPVPPLPLPLTLPLLQHEYQPQQFQFQQQQHPSHQAMFEYDYSLMQSPPTYSTISRTAPGCQTDTTDGGDLGNHADCSADGLRDAIYMQHESHDAAMMAADKRRRNVTMV